MLLYNLVLIQPCHFILIVTRYDNIIITFSFYLAKCLGCHTLCHLAADSVDRIIYSVDIFTSIRPTFPNLVVNIAPNECVMFIIRPPEYATCS